MDFEDEAINEPLIPEVEEELVNADDLFGNDPEEQPNEPQNADANATNDATKTTKKRKHINRLANLNEKWLVTNKPGIRDVNSYFKTIKLRLINGKTELLLGMDIIKKLQWRSEYCDSAGKCVRGFRIWSLGREGLVKRMLSNC